MKYLHEYRDYSTTREYAEAIGRICHHPWNIMEICGGQTHAILRFGLDQLLPESIRLIHGPGCPVCVTGLEVIDRAIYIAKQSNVIFCSFGDMLRVPGSREDLFSVKAAGHDVRIVYSPLDALQIAVKNPDKEVVFFAIGFETTVPANAMALVQARKKNIGNFRELVSQVRVPPAMDAILFSPQNQVQGFLTAGHVNTVMGYDEYEELAQKFKVPMVVTGFEPVDIMHSIFLLVQMLERGEVGVVNGYARMVQKEGNPSAIMVINEVFTSGDQYWRGIGLIPNSGLLLRSEYAPFDANLYYGTEFIQVQEPPECISGLILQGIEKPSDCNQFGKLCTPDHPLGATMVSSEGACAAYYKYRKE